MVHYDLLGQWQSAETYSKEQDTQGTCLLAKRNLSRSSPTNVSAVCGIVGTHGTPSQSESPDVVHIAVYFESHKPWKKLKRSVIGEMFGLSSDGN